MADKLGLSRIATDDSHIIRGDDGHHIDLEDGPDWLEEVLSLLEIFRSISDPAFLKRRNNMGH